MMTAKFSRQSGWANGDAPNCHSLVVWLKDGALAKTIFRLTCVFQLEDTIGLIKQTLQASASAPSNIAMSSLAVRVRQLTWAVELDLPSAENVKSCVDLIDEPRRMLNGLRRAESDQRAPACNHSHIAHHII